MNQEKIGRFIAELRKDKGLTQEQLAEKLGITKNAVSKWERGLGLMDMSLLKSLSEILQVSVTEILNGERINKEDISSTEEPLLESLDYSSKKNKKTRKNKIITTLVSILIILVLIVLLDTIQSLIFNNKPLLSINPNWDNKGMYSVDKGIFVNHYRCVLNDDKTVFKWEKFSCPLTEDDSKIKEIVDTTKNKKDFTCAEALEEFYRDDNYIYFYSCIKSKYIVVRYKNGKEETVENALKKGTITIEDLDRFNIDYIKRENLVE